MLSDLFDLLFDLIEFVVVIVAEQFGVKVSDELIAVFGRLNLQSMASPLFFVWATMGTSLILCGKKKSRNSTIFAHLGLPKIA